MTLRKGTVLGYLEEIHEKEDDIIRKVKTGESEPKTYQPVRGGAHRPHERYYQSAAETNGVGNKNEVVRNMVTKRTRENNQKLRAAINFDK